MIDLDHFKQINDRYGHHAGDAALQFFGQLLQRCLRAGDVAARLGGEEFAVLLALADTDAALAFDQRLRKALAAVTPNELPVTPDFSAGHALCRGREDTLAGMMARADTALYRAKAAGRGRPVSDTGATTPLTDISAQPLV
jgi:diguanylate cyclase (GGDEF)-like protein